jgi:type I restriction enzyme, S subunit
VIESFAIPDSWLQMNLGEIINYGKTEKAEPTEIPSDAWVLELEDIEKDSSKLLQRLTFTQRQSKSTKNRFRAGDVLYGKLRPYLNKILIADRDGYCSTEILPLRANQAINGRFLFYWLKHPAFLNYVEAVSHGLNMPRLGTESGKQAPLVLAPLNEQKRIADKLDRLLAKVDACRERCDRIPLILKRFRQSVLAAATSGELTEDWREKHSVVQPAKNLIKETRFKIADSDENLQLLPDTWEWVALGNYAQCSRGRFSVRPRNDPAYFNGAHPFIQIGDLPSEGGWINAHKQTLNDKGLTVSKKFPKATVVIAIVGATIGNTGLLAYEMCFTDSMVGIETGNEVSNRYIEFFLRHRKEDIRKISYAGGGQPNIKLEILNPYPLALPPIEEQQEIVRRVEKLFAFADRLEARYQAARAKCNQLTPALLEKAFQGELVSQDPNDEPASVLLERIKSQRSNAETNQTKPQRRKTASE